MIKRRLVGLLIGFGLICLVSCENKNSPVNDEFVVTKYNPAGVQKNNNMSIFVHYMPWFENRSSSPDGNWGMHWTMATRNPDITDNDGKREIASHFYPLTGPYASSDPDIIEYQLLLMKYSGIDGILIDWYGASDVNDYGLIRENSEDLIDHIDDAGLKFAIVYEDRSISAALEQNPGLDPIEAASEDMSYIEDHYFDNSSYIYIDEKPLFMVFGPEEFHEPSKWTDIMSAFDANPLFLILNGKSSQTAPGSSGEYIWVDNTSLENKYATMNHFDYFMGGAYPGFLDYYEEGGWGTGFDWQIDHNNGETFRQNLQLAGEYDVPYLQLITWNDYGEGTMIEPTDEFGTKMLEILQEFTGVQYTKYELEKIHALYTLRKDYAQDDEKQKLLDQSFYYFVSLQTEPAIAIVDSLSALPVK